MSPMGKLFRATSQDAGNLVLNLQSRFPDRDFTLSHTSYPRYNDISCFEIRCSQGLSKGVETFIEGYILGFHAAPA